MDVINTRQAEREAQWMQTVVVSLTFWQIDQR
jgi:hypothetical protein